MDPEDFGAAVQICPSGMKDLRACLGCALIKTERQFAMEGCDNCNLLGMEDKSDYVEYCTSRNFKGMISLMEPVPRTAADDKTQGSWAASWLHLDTKQRGCYALSVTGTLPERAESREYNYNRDRSTIAAKQ
eukprot:m.82137 g.82137  ORF g.82137 m.82137 type:complete len:132 (-) comp25491_c0_seq1:310-705(-)